MMSIRPCAPLGLVPTFGFGDRLGLATLGHIDAWRASGGAIQPIFAQQSIRELARTGRKATDVMRDTQAHLTAGSFTGIWGADADRLKTPEDINMSASAGFTTLTFDANEFVDLSAAYLSPQEVDRRAHALREDLQWTEEYRGTLQLSPTHRLNFDPCEVRRAALKYGAGISHAVKLASHAERIMGKRREAYELEVTFDEVPQVASPIEHFLIADQLLKGNLRLASLGLRWSAELEPAIDFQGNVSQFTKEIALHAAIARHLGPYKLCLHSGSDKFRLYETFARTTAGLFQVKTAGTSYLEGLRVAARQDRRLFRRIVEFARQRFDQDRAPYLVSARTEQVPQCAAIADDQKLEQLYLNDLAGRQILHVTFGSVLADAVLGSALRDCLVAHPDLHRQVVARHLGRHLEFLNRGMKGLIRNGILRGSRT